VGALIALGNTVSGAGAGFHIWLAVAGFASGLFLVPLYAFIQQTAGAHRRGRMLAGVGLLDSLAGLAGSGLFFLTASDHMMDLSPRTQFFLLAGLTLAGLAYALWHTSHQVVSLALRGLTRKTCL
jgi:acyl-[acyl-carrier-protein]-phospholipid O-acyltransferase/long-chain-fatty-acid--[acyl-carrier-protein] ligase